MMTAGDLIEFLQGFDPSTTVHVQDFNIPTVVHPITEMTEDVLQMDGVQPEDQNIIVINTTPIK